MKIAYYRDAAGIIKQHSKIPDEWSEDDLAMRLLRYNQEHPEYKATIVEIEPGSFEEYLFGLVKTARQRAKDDIQAALDAIEEARDAIQDLEVDHAEGH